MPVCVSGMHRSGTSMVTNLLADGGLDLGAAEDLMSASPDNPEGFWENRRFVAFNDVLLAELGGAWDLPPNPAADWSAAGIATIGEAARGLVAEFAGREPWGWKDPRNCLTIPFWREIAGPLRHIFVVRHPLEVARSLQKRNGFSQALGLSLWYEYAARFLAATRPDERLVTHFDAYFADPAREIGRILVFAGLPHDEGTVAGLVGGAAVGLKHHRLAAVDLLDANVAPSIVNLYGDLCREAGHDDALGGRRGPALADPPVAAFRPGTLAAGVGRFDLWLFTQQQRLHELEVAIAIHEMARQELEGRITERDGMVNEREGRITDLNGRIADLHGRLADRERVMARLNQEITALRQTVADQEHQSRAMAEQVQTLLRHEETLRAELTAAHDHLMFYDAEVMGTMGGALARVAPGAPAAIYYRQLLEKVRGLAQQHLPTDAVALVATYGDDAFLDLAGRRTAPFPQRLDGGTGSYRDIEAAAAVGQIEELRALGAAYLVVPSPAQAWLARLPALGKHLEEHYPAVVHEQGVCTIYALHDAA